MLGTYPSGAQSRVDAGSLIRLPPAHFTNAPRSASHHPSNSWIIDLHSQSLPHKRPAASFANTCNDFSQLLAPPPLRSRTFFPDCLYPLPPDAYYTLSPDPPIQPCDATPIVHVFLYLVDPHTFLLKTQNLGTSESGGRCRNTKHKYI